MKRIGNLWEQIISFENILAASRAAAAGKRMRPDVARFLFDQELEIARLQRELTDGTYTPGSYRCFIVNEPKRRMISAAPFRDRVVHHALTRVLEPIFEQAAFERVERGLNCAAVPGTTMRGTRAFRIATTTSPRTGTTT